MATHAFNDMCNQVKEYLEDHTVKQTYNHFTRSGVEVICDKDFIVIVEAHYMYSSLFVSLSINNRIIKQAEISPHNTIDYVHL